VPPADEPGTAGRRAELAVNLAAVRSRIATACAAAGRPADAVTLVAVTKTFPASDVRLLAGLGITDVGENYDAEAAAKAVVSADLSLTWHFIGQVQTRKAASVAAYADVVHSVDRPRLITALGRRAAAAGREVLCLVQVSLDEPDPGGPGERSRGGAPPAQVPELADAIAAEPGLALGGVMALAPPGAQARPAFARLREISALVAAAHPAATMISAGMSADMSDAIAEGATLVRIGTALLGGRRAFVR
jgi:PLP dependent protein